MPTERYITYVEDDEDDVQLLRDCLENFTTVSLRHFTDIKTLLLYLGSLPPADLPFLVLLDRVMPAFTLEETIAKLKESNFFPAIPTAVLTTTVNRKDEEVCKNLNVSLFVKPSSYEGWNRLCQILVERYA